MTNYIIFSFPFLSTSQGGHIGEFFLIRLPLADGMEGRGFGVDDGRVFITLWVSPLKTKYNSNRLLKR